MRPRRLAIAAVLVLFAFPATADEKPAFDPHAQARLFMVRDTIVVRGVVEEFRKKLALGRIIPALRDAQRVLDRHADDFILVDEPYVDATGRTRRTSTPQSVLWRSAAEVIRESLATLPPGSRAHYETLTASRAAPLMAEALARRSRKPLRTVLLQYGASNAGRHAGELLARLAVEEGAYRDAVWFATEALRFHPGDAGLWRIRIDALALLGDRAALDRLRLPPAVGNIGDGGGPDLQAVLDVARETTPVATTTRDWPMWGGDPSRSRTFPHVSPVPRSLRWTEYTDFVERQRDRQSPWYREGQRHPEFRAMLKTFRPSHPVLEGRTVYVADGRSLRAHDIYSGRRLWTFDATRYPGGKGAPFALLNPGQSYPGRTSIERPFAPVVAGDLVVGTVEEKLPYYPDTLQRIEISTYLPRRRLVAVDKQTGDVRWVFASHGLDMLQYGHLSFVGSPVESEGMILGLASAFDGVHSLVFLAIDAKTGKAIWDRQVGTGQQELNLFGVPVKELAASPVTVADGTAYVSTGVGFVAALDVRTGVPRWLASYETIPVRAVEYWYRSPLRLPKVSASPPIVHGDLLLIAPSDGRYLHAFDRRTGRLSWRTEIIDPDAAGLLDYDVFAHILGVANDGRRDVIITTDARVVARALEDDPATAVDERGQIVWKSMEVDEIRGTGALAGGEVVVPSAEGLFRFSVKGQGKLASPATEWPDDAEPGNIFPLERVLIVAGRDSLQWFYDWADLERDVARRRRENPDDPSILLEAGELYLRARDETERARRAFGDALRIAQRSAPEFVAPARHGLLLAWRREAALREGNPAEAAAALERAHAYADTAASRVEVRLEIHAVHEGNVEARRKNLAALVTEAGSARLTFDPTIGPVHARAHALLLSAALEAKAGTPRAAVDHLQRVIRELGDERHGTVTLRDKARDEIETLLAREGRTIYAAHETQARKLVADARSRGDSRLLEQVIREYPNAEVLADALLVRAGQRLQDGDIPRAIELARQILAGEGHQHVAPDALALLARAYRLRGARGAAELTLERLASRYATATVTLGEARMTAREFATAERAALPARDERPVPGLAAPLTELGFQAVVDDGNSRVLEVQTSLDARGQPAPAGVAVVSFGSRCVVFDMRTGKIAWRASPGAARHAAWVPSARGDRRDGRLVLAVRGALKGFDDLGGTSIWTQSIRGFVRDLEVQGGVVYAVVQENNLAGSARLLAVDAIQGDVIWSRELGPDIPRRLRVSGNRVLLERARWSARRNAAHLLLFDSFDGRPVKEIPIPTQTESGDRVIVSGALVLASRELDRSANRTVRRLIAYDLERGVQRWRRAIPVAQPVTALAGLGGNVIALQSDGSVLTVDGASGNVLGRIRIVTGEPTAVRPFVQSRMIVTEDTLTLLPAARPSTRKRPAKPALMCFDRKTGARRWARPYPPGTDLNAARVMDFGNVLAVVISHRRQFKPHVNIRLVGRADGALLQELVPTGLSQKQWVPSSQVGYGTLIVFGKRGASVFRRPQEASAAPSRR